jgi:hypothetical protein
MDNVRLKLKISTLKAVVALSYVAGDSLRTTFEYEGLKPHERRAVFARWHQVRRDGDRATIALETLIRCENGLRATADFQGATRRPETASDI